MANDPLARAGLAALLAEQPGCSVVGRLTAHDEWSEHVAEDDADVIVWDLGWEPVEPLADLQTLPLPVLTLLPDDTLAPQAWQAGARGLLRREAGAEMIVAAAHALAHELTVLDPTFQSDLFDQDTVDRDAAVEALTAREMEVLQLMAEGLTNKGIALQLEISDHTVKYHVNAILGKLGAQSRTEAVVRATRLGIIAL